MGTFPSLTRVFARAISVAPAHPQTIAVAHAGSLDEGLCGDTAVGIGIYDSEVQRPHGYGPRVYGISSIAWGASIQSLYAEDWNSVSEFPIAADGVGSPLSIYDYRYGEGLYDLSRDLQFDAITGRLYDSLRGAYDTRTHADLGRYAADWGLGVMSPCGSPLSAMTTDRTSGKIFFASYQPETTGLVLSTFDAPTLQQTGSYKLPYSTFGGSIGFPLRTTRPTSDTLAITTSGGYLLLLRGSVLSP